MTKQAQYPSLNDKIIRRKIISEKQIPRAVWLVFSTAHLVLVLDTKQNKEVYFLYFIISLFKTVYS